MPTYERLRAIFMARRACFLRTFFGTTSKGLCWGGGGGGGRGGGGGGRSGAAKKFHTSCAPRRFAGSTSSIDPRIIGQKPLSLQNANYH